MNGFDTAQEQDCFVFRGVAGITAYGTEDIGLSRVQIIEGCRFIRPGKILKKGQIR